MAAISKLTLNVGRPDRAIRMVVGFLIIALGLLFGSWWGLVGLVFLLTGLFGFCPIYRAFGVSTCAVR